MYVLNSHITIGKFSCKGVHEVRIKKSIRTYRDMATIWLPAHASMIKKSDPDNIRMVETANEIAEGDHVTIKLGYNDELAEEFRGFVRRVNFSTPCEVECEGYSYQLDRNNVNKYFANASAREVLEAAISGTDIKLQLADDLPAVSGVKCPDRSGAELLDYLIGKVYDNAVTAFFIQPDVLYVGLRYTAFKNTVKVTLGKNAIRDGQLKLRDDAKLKVTIHYVNKKPNGSKVSGKRDNGVGKLLLKRLSHILSDADLEKLASAKLDRINYNGFEGRITTLGRPIIEPGDKVDLLVPHFDKFKNERGSYIAETVDVRYGLRGYRRIVGIGAKV